MVVVVGLGGPLEWEGGPLEWDGEHPRMGGGPLEWDGMGNPLEGEGETLEWDGGDPKTIGTNIGLYGLKLSAFILIFRGDPNGNTPEGSRPLI